MRYNRLCSLIRLKGLTNGEFAQKIGIAPSNFSLKVNNKRAFTQPEIDRILKEMGATYEEVFGKGGKADDCKETT